MLNEIRASLAGNLTADPELVFTPSGHAVARFTVASAPRIRTDEGWQDGETTFTPCELWRQPAENFSESASRGARVLVAGTYRTDRWSDKESGEQRSRLKLVVDEAAISTTYATAVPRKVSKGNGGPPPTDPHTGEVADRREPPEGE